MKRYGLGLLLAMAGLLVAPRVEAAGAELISGYTYGVNSPSNLVTYANLNSHVKDATLAAGAITNRPYAAFNTNFWVMVASNGVLYKMTLTNLVPAASISTNELNADVAGLGLGGGSGFPLSNKTDNAFLKITNDVLTIDLAAFTNLISVLASNIAGYITTNYAYAGTNQFVSYDYSISSAGAVASTNHGLGGTPKFVRWVLYCATADSPYAVGDEVDIAAPFNSNNESAFSSGANSTNVFCSRTSDTGTGNVEWVHQTTGSGFQPTLSRWRARCYARP